MSSTELILLAILIVVCVSYHLGVKIHLVKPGIGIKIHLVKPGKLSLAQFVNVTTSASAVIVVGSRFHTLITSQQVRSLLGEDMVFTLFIGVAAVIWVSIHQMLKP